MDNNNQANYTGKPDKTIKRYLRHDFTDADRLGISKDLAEANLQKARIEDEKKSVNSDFKSRIDRIDADINKLAQALASDFEMRNVECHVYYNKPNKGLKTIINAETSEVVSVEKMSPEEAQMTFDETEKADSPDIEGENPNAPALPEPDGEEPIDIDDDEDEGGDEDETK